MKITLAVSGTGPSVAGNVTITAPSDGAILLNPLVVGAGQVANTELYLENLDTSGALTWRDFAVTGVTATNTKLYLWTKV